MSTPPAIPSHVTAGSDASSDQYNEEVVDVINWLVTNAPRGPQGTPASTTASTATTTTTTIDAGLSVTFTAVAGRKYEHRISAHWLSDAVSTELQCRITDGSNTVLARFNVVCAAANIADHRYIEWTETPTSGSTTRKIRLLRTSGAGNVSRFADSDRASTYEIRDVGSA